MGKSEGEKAGKKVTYAKRLTVKSSALFTFDQTLLRLILPKIFKTLSTCSSETSSFFKKELIFTVSIRENQPKVSLTLNSKNVIMY